MKCYFAEELINDLADSIVLLRHDASSEDTTPVILPVSVEEQKK